MADKDLQVIASSGDLTGMNFGGTATTNKVTTKGEQDAAYQDVSGESAIIKTKYTPQATGPTYVEGTEYYNDVSKTFNLQGPFEGIEVSPGHGQHIHIINNSGAEIPAGMAVRPDGIASGKVQIVKALADTFAHARILGVTIIAIPDGEESAIATSGVITDINTNGQDLGTPLFLSDTVAGTYSSTAPAIRTQVGGAFVADATAGVLYVQPINNVSTPTVFGGLMGQTSPTYAVTTTSQDIVDYTSKDEVVTDADLATGEITIPNDGEYRVHFTAAITFPTSTSTRSITLELYDSTAAAVHFPYVKNVPRDATEDSLSFSWPFSEVAGNVHKMRIKASEAIAVTFDEISFDVTSVSIIA